MAGCDDARHGRELVGSRQPPLAKVIHLLQWHKYTAHSCGRLVRLSGVEDKKLSKYLVVK